MRPIRIGVVSLHAPPYAGGIAEATQRMVDGYRTLGFEVRWVASRVPETAAEREADLRRVKCRNFMESAFGIPWPIWGLEGHRELKTLARWADLVHVQECAHFCSAMAVGHARAHGKPVLLSQHIGFIEYRSAVARGLLRALYATLGRWVMAQCARVVYCNVSAEEYLEPRMPFLKGRTTRIGCAVDTRRFAPAGAAERAQAKQAWGLPEDRPAVLFVGRLVEKKRPDIVYGLSNASRHVFVVGDGLMRPPRNQANLTWVPNVPAEKMPSVYHAADAVVLPAYGEGLPIVVLEAMACRVPVILADTQTYARRLAGEGLCLAVRGGAAEFDAAARQLAARTSDAEAMCRRAREYVMREHSFEGTARAYAAVVEELLQIPAHERQPAGL